VPLLGTQGCIVDELNTENISFSEKIKLDNKIEQRTA